MRVYTIAALLIVVILTLDALGEAEGWFGGSRSRSSSSSSSRSRSSSVGRSRNRSTSRRTSSTRRTGGVFGGRSRSRSIGSSRSRSTSRTSSRRTTSTRRTGGFWGSRRTNTRSSPSKTKRVSVSVKKSNRGTTIKAGKTTVHVNNFGKIRGRDKTGHRTGLGTLGRKIISQPKKTFEAVKSFVKNYNTMKSKNLKGGNLQAHRKANKDATKKSDAKTAGAISALREQYKNFRVKKDKRDGSIHIGDTRTKKERDDTMNANKQGREDAKKGTN